MVSMSTRWALGMACMIASYCVPSARYAPRAVCAGAWNGSIAPGGQQLRHPALCAKNRASRRLPWTPGAQDSGEQGVAHRSVRTPSAVRDGVAQACAPV